MYYVHFCLLFPLVILGTVQIVNGPQSILNATLGQTVWFDCILNSEYDDPAWNIDGIDYQTTDLPLGYAFLSSLYSNKLILNSTREEMNNTCYFCYLLTFEGRQESEIAKLTIQPFLYTTPSRYYNAITSMILTYYIMPETAQITRHQIETQIYPRISDVPSEPKISLQKTHIIIIITGKLL